jgi:hypothetical protein
VIVLINAFLLQLPANLQQKRSFGLWSGSSVIRGADYMLAKLAKTVEFVNRMPPQ